MKTITLSTRGDWVLCRFRYDEDLKDDLKRRFSARWTPANSGRGGTWSIDISHERDLLDLLDAYGYEVSIA